MDNRISRIPRPIVDKSALPNVSAVAQPNVMYANAPNIIDTLQNLDVPESQTAPVTIQTASTPITASNPLNGVLVTLATLGIITAGAGAITMTATALAKKKEQDEVKATQMATLQKQRSAQAQTASANWAENQAMQANATQKVYTKVQQSQANKFYFDNIRRWRRDKAYQSAIGNIIINSRVTFTLIDANGRSNYSLGTIANYNGQQVLVTHDHFSPNKSETNVEYSLNYIQRNFSKVYIDGVLGNTTIDVNDLEAQFMGVGVMFLSLKNGGDFGVTSLEAEIAFNYYPQNAEDCYYNYVPDFNTYSASQVQDNNGNMINVIPYSALEIGVTSVHFEANSEYPNSVRTTWGGHAARGDSGTGLFNSEGKLIGVLRETDIRDWRLDDLLINFPYHAGWTAEPASMDNLYNIIEM